jgi:hypothetical protein
VITAKQMLDWLDGRNGSSFANMTWNGTTLGFTISVASGANGLQAMLPMTSGTRAMTSLTLNGAPVSYVTEVIKGINYARFTASGSGTYAAQYAVDGSGPAISGVTANASSSFATVAWTTSEAASTRVDYGTSASSLSQTVSIAGQRTSHSVQLSPLTSGTTYYYRITSADSSGNTTTSPLLPAAPASFTTTTPPSLNCPCSVWAGTAVPAQVSVGDASAIELGLRFRASFDGFITGVRFYKGPQNTGAHTGKLWSNSGTLLASVTFSGESASGWQQALFSSPVAVTANTPYVVSYHTETGFYSADGAYFQSTGVVNGPLEGLANGAAGSNGVYRYGASAFPADTFNATNYWVDVVFVTAIAADTTPPVVSNVVPAAAASGVVRTTSVRATFSEAVNAATVTAANVELRDGANALVPATLTYDAGSLTATLQPSAALAYGASYTARVRGGASGIADSAGNRLAADMMWSFTTELPPTFGFTDTTAADFGAGTVDAGTYVSQMADGEVILAPAVTQEFSGTTLPTGWSLTPWSAGSSMVVNNGQVAVDGGRVSFDALQPGSQSLEFSGTFSTDTFEHVGLGVTFDDTPWAMFSTGNGGGLYARTHDGTTPSDTLIPGSWIGAPHVYRIVWLPASVQYFVDGTLVATHAATITTQMRPIISNFNVGAAVATVDWMRMSPYAAAGTFTSRVLDGGQIAGWSGATWSADVPQDTTLSLAARFGNTAVPNGTWTAWIPMTGSGSATLSGRSRYIQYQAVMASTGTATPTLRNISFTAPVPGPLPSVSVNDINVTEGNGGIRTATFTVTLSAVSLDDVSVQYATANGTATSPSDFANASGTATITAGSLSGTFSVDVIADTTPEVDETFLVNLTAPENATLGDAQGQATIVNDDLPQLSVNDVTVTEGNSATVQATFTVTMVPASSQTVTVNWATAANASATAGSDYTTASGSVSFPAGQTTRTFTVNVLGDSIDEPNETFLVNLSNPANATLGDAQGVGTIADNDPSPSVEISNDSVTEPSSASSTVNADFTVALSGPSAQTITMNYSTADGTATAGVDYTAASGTLTFTPGQTSKTITVVVRGDNLDENTETFLVNLTDLVNATVDDVQGTGSIGDNDSSPTMSVNNATVTEGTGANVNAVFTVTLSAVSGRTVTVDYDTSNGTATTPSDYTDIAGTLSFAPGETSKQITVVVIGDSTDENTETFSLNLDDVSGATLSDDEGLGTINDNDEPVTPNVTVNNVTVTEPDFGTINATFTITLSAPTTRTVTVNYSTSNGTASSSSDYNSASGSVTFTAGQTTRTVAVGVRGDRTDESNETFNFNLTSATNAVITDNVGIGTINNDD